jgi:hypothetical protein
VNRSVHGCVNERKNHDTTNSKTKIEVPKHDQKTKVPEPKPKPPKVTKKAIVEKLLKQDGGVTIEEVAEKTSWQHHTIRGHFSTIKKLGNEVIHTIRDGKRYYSIKSN